MSEVLDRASDTLGGSIFALQIALPDAVWRRLVNEHAEVAEAISTDAADLARLAGELEAANTTKDRAVSALAQALSFRDGHPDMCCGKCRSAIAKAEAESSRLRALIVEYAEAHKATPATFSWDDERHNAAIAALLAEAAKENKS